MSSQNDATSGGSGYKRKAGAGKLPLNKRSKPSNEEDEPKIKRADNSHKGDLAHALVQTLYAYVVEKEYAKTPLAETTADLYEIIGEVLGYARYSDEGWVPSWKITGKERYTLPRLDANFVARYRGTKSETAVGAMDAFWKDINPTDLDAITQAGPSKIAENMEVDGDDPKQTEEEGGKKKKPKAKAKEKEKEKEADKEPKSAKEIEADILRQKQETNKRMLSDFLKVIDKSPKILGTRKVRCRDVAGGMILYNMPMSEALRLILAYLNNPNHWTSQVVPASLPDSDILSEILSRCSSVLFPKKLPEGERSFSPMYHCLGYYGQRVSEANRRQFVRILNPLTTMATLIKMNNAKVKSDFMQRKRGLLIRHLKAMCPCNAGKNVVDYMQAKGFNLSTCAWLCKYFMHNNFLISRPTWRLANIGTPQLTDEEYWTAYNQGVTYCVAPDAYHVIMISAQTENIEVLDRVFLGPQEGLQRTRDAIPKSELIFDPISPHKVMSTLRKRLIYWNPIVNIGKNELSKFVISTCLVPQNSVRDHDEIERMSGMTPITWDEVVKGLTTNLQRLKAEKTLFGGYPAKEWTPENNGSFGRTNAKIELKTLTPVPFR